MELTREVLNQIFYDYMYHKDDITVKGITEKYKLDISPSRLKSILPLPDSDSNCPYCNTVMKRKIIGRGEYGVPYCDTCGHKDYDDTSHTPCRCKNCDEERKQIIKNLYGIRREKKSFSTLPTSAKILVGKVLDKTDYKNFEIIKGNILINNGYYNDLRDMDLISVSPTSGIDAFALDDRFPLAYYPFYAIFEWKIDFSDEEKEELSKGDYFSNVLTDNEKMIFLNQYIHTDVLNRFKYLMEERGLELEVLPTAESLFMELYQELSYSEIVTLCFHVARYCLDQTKTGKMYKKFAQKGALKMATTFWENDKKRGWPLAKSEVGYCGTELKWFIQNVIKSDLSILNSIITIETITNQRA